MNAFILAALTLAGSTSQAELSTVRVESGHSAGSAVAFWRDSRYVYFFTADHVLDGANITVEPLDRPLSFPAKCLAASRSMDLAVLRIRTSARLTAVRVRSSNAGLTHPFAARYCGFARGRPPRLKHVACLGSRYITSSHRRWITDRAPIPGESGGPLIGPDGTLIGICLASAGDQGIFAHLADLHAILDQCGLAGAYRSDTPRIAQNTPPHRDDSPPGDIPPSILRIIERIEDQPPFTIRRPESARPHIIILGHGQQPHGHFRIVVPGKRPFQHHFVPIDGDW